MNLVAGYCFAKPIGRMYMECVVIFVKAEASYSLYKTVSQLCAYNYGMAVIDPIMCNTDQGSVQMSDTHGSIGGQPLGQPVVPIA